MKHILVVANQTLGGRELQEVIAARVAAEECSLRVLVPVTPVPPNARIRPLHGSEGALGATAAAAGPDDAASVRAAEVRLEREVDRLRALHPPAGGRLVVSGELGDADPVRAVRDALRSESVDEIVLATLPPGVSRWLGQDVVHRLRRAVHVPVTHVVCTQREVVASTPISKR